MSRGKKNTKDINDEVEELLRAAEDAALLKISLNSHTVHASPSDLHPDLEQRFQDLKSGSKSKAKQESKTRETPSPQSSEMHKEVEEDDLLARFAALKATLPKPSSSSLVGVGTSDASVEDMLAGSSLDGNANIDDEDEEDDEVEKVIRWAKDAARLDPSPSSDDEDIEDDVKDDDDSDDNETSDVDAESSLRNSKGQRK